MPTVTLDRTELFARLGRSYTDEEFDELCFQFGVELDDVVEDAATKRVTYAIAVAANRTDLLCVEGLSRAIVSFLGNAEPPVYAITPPRGAQIIMHVKPSTQAIRPYVVCAVLRGVTFTQARYDSFIDLQDKLHNNIARKRTLVAIGTHDLDTLEPPFVYEALSPQDISFVPLSQTRAFRADELMEFYRTDPSVKHIKPYVDIIGSRYVAHVLRTTTGSCDVVRLPLRVLWSYLCSLPAHCLALMCVSLFLLQPGLPRYLRRSADRVLLTAHHKRRALQGLARDAQRFHRVHGDGSHQGACCAERGRDDVCRVRRSAVHC